MNNFAVLNIGYFPNPHTLTITTATNNRCHLTCFYTDQAPRYHKTSRTERGLTLPWGAYFCFVAYKTVEQTEPGDTYDHTFEIPHWSYCQTKWFAFRGTIAEVLSPSVSCLFKYHHPGAQVRLFEHYIVNDDDEKTIFNRHWRGQSFTPLIPHRITSVKLLLRRVGFPGIVTVSIRPTAFGKPVGLDWCFGTTDGNTLTTDGAGEWREITFEPRPSLIADTMYAKVVRAIDADTNNCLRWRDDNSRPAYPRGAYLVSESSGTNWDIVYETDMMFQEWGIPT